MNWSMLIPFSGVLFMLIVIEFAFSAKNKWSNYDWKETLSSVGVKYIRLGTGALYIVAFGPFFMWVYSHRIWTLQLDPVAEMIFYFLLTELSYYCSHRFSHTYAIGWASHATHHTLKKLNFTCAGRVDVTSPFSFYYFIGTPLFFFGVHPQTFLVYASGILFYQAFIHTEIVPKIKFLDAFLNTPSNHRVHHGTQAIYVDKNFGGVTIIFDRLFGTYQKELDDQKPVFGLIAGEHTHNPLRLCIIGWEHLFQGRLNRRLK